MKDNRQRLFEVLGKIDPTFKPKAGLLTEWNFDKKKGEDKEDDKKEDKEEKFEKEEKKETPEHEAAETPEEEKKEHEEKKELKEADAPDAKKVPVACWDKAKVGGK